MASNGDMAHDAVFYAHVCFICDCLLPSVCVVPGATGGVGKRVVQKLLSQGRVVRALVRDVGKAQELLVGLVAVSNQRAEREWQGIEKCIGLA